MHKSLVLIRLRLGHTKLPEQLLRILSPTKIDVMACLVEFVVNTSNVKQISEVLSQSSPLLGGFWASSCLRGFDI